MLQRRSDRKPGLYFGRATTDNKETKKLRHPSPSFFHTFSTHLLSCNDGYIVSEGSLSQNNRRRPITRAWKIFLYSLRLSKRATRYSKECPSCQANCVLLLQQNIKQENLSTLSLFHRNQTVRLSRHLSEGVISK